MPLISRRQFLLGSGLAGSTLFSGYALGIEPNRPSVVRQTLQSEDPVPGCRTRFVQLSDLHLRGIGRLEQETARLVREARPEFVVVTGDCCNGGEYTDDFDRFLTLTGVEAPVYGVPGNWEHSTQLDFGRLDAVYRRHGGRLLVNETVSLRRGGADILLTGLDGCNGGEVDVARALRGAVPSPNHLILAHYPTTRDRVAGQLAELRAYTPLAVLAGHTHGGQVTFFGIAPYLPAGSGNYTHGWYGGSGPRMFVSRGIGTTDIPMRFMAPPEVVCFEWQLGRRDGHRNRKEL